MPQLDILTFQNSYLWFLIIFFGFFYIFSIFLLPNIYYIFRVREKYNNDLKSINRFVSEFNKGLAKLDLSSPRPVLFETSTGLHCLDASKLASSSLKSYVSILKSLSDKCTLVSTSQQYIFYVLSCSTLIPTFSTVIILANDYSELLQSE